MIQGVFFFLVKRAVTMPSVLTLCSCFLSCSAKGALACSALSLALAGVVLPRCLLPSFSCFSWAIAFVPTQSGLVGPPGAYIPDWGTTLPCLVHTAQGLHELAVAPRWQSLCTQGLYGEVNQTTWVQRFACEVPFQMFNAAVLMKTVQWT